MTEREVGQILKAIDRLEKLIGENHILLVGNGDRDAVLPRLNATENRLTLLEVTASETKKVQPAINAIKAGWELAQPILYAVIIAGILYLIFGP